MPTMHVSVAAEDSRAPRWADPREKSHSSDLRGDECQVQSRPPPHHPPTPLAEVPSHLTKSHRSALTLGLVWLILVFVVRVFFSSCCCVGLVAGRQVAPFCWQQLWFLVLICEIGAEKGQVVG